MKKINLILGACAIAAAALFVSCNNGTKDYVNVKTINNKYAYNVTGSVTNTSKSGSTTAASVTVTTATIKNAIANVDWSEDKLNDSNYDYYTINFNGTANWTTSYTAAGSTTATTSKFTDKFGKLSTSTTYYTVSEGWYDMDLITDPTDPSDWTGAFISANYGADTSSATAPEWVYYGMYRIPTGTTSTISSISLEIYEFDGDFYVKDDNEYVKLPEDAIDGDFGDDEITIKYTLSNADTRTGLTETEKNDTTVVRSSETAYNFTFKLVEAE